MFDQLTAAADIRQGMTEIDRIKENHTKQIEEKVCALIQKCRKQKVNMTDKELDKEFDEMWNKAVNEVSFSKPKPTDVIANVSLYLRTNLRGSHVCDLLSQKRLQDCEQEPFECTGEGFIKQFKHQVSKIFNVKDGVMGLQKIADRIIMNCNEFVNDKVKRKNNYYDTCIQEILHKIDEKLQNSLNGKIENQFEVSLKQHICGFATRQFKKMHEGFLREMIPPDV